MKNVQTLIDKSAIGLSLLCMIHCLLLPLAIALLPVMASMPLVDESFHELLLLGILPTSFIALMMGCRKHKVWSIIFWGGLGLVILVLTALFAHQVLGSVGEKLATVVGSVFIIISHIKNYKLCNVRRCEC